MRIALNQNHSNIFRNRLCVGLPPLDHLVGQVGVTNEFVLTGERARLSVHWNCCHSKTFRSQELTSLHSSAWSSMTRIYPRPDLPLVASWTLAPKLLGEG